MNFTAEERRMYDVMKAIYDSGISVNFKGAMVLKACLMEAGYAEDIRHTVDIDANWYSDEPPSAEKMIESFQKAISQSGLGLKVRLYRMYGAGRSAGFELADDSEEVLFTMDVDVNRSVPLTKIYEIAGIKFRGVSPIQMIADKIAAISSEKVFQRIKDVVDLYYISNVFTFDCAAVLDALENSGRVLGDFNGFLNRSEELRHSYEKFRFVGNGSRIPFDEVYQTVKSYIDDILPKIKA